MFSSPGVDGREAPGLNEKAGKAGDRGTDFSSSTLAFAATLRGSIADRGRLPAARGIEVGPEEEDGRAGKTNGGFGGGGFVRGDVCESEGSSWEAVSSIVEGPKR